jgi:hypothetical protein
MCWPGVRRVRRHNRYNGTENAASQIVYAHQGMTAGSQACQDFT